MARGGFGREAPCFLLAALTLLLSSTAAKADVGAQISTRLDLGGGASLYPSSSESETAVDAVFQWGLRADCLFGESLPDRFRIGPTLALQLEGLERYRLAGGLTGLLPLERGFALWATGSASWVGGPEEGQLELSLRVAGGFRPYNFHGVYAYGLGLYLEAQLPAEKLDRFRLIFGVEIDFEFLVAIPALFLWEWLGAEDPDEGDP